MEFIISWITTVPKGTNLFSAYERNDVYNDFFFFNEKNAGFNMFIEREFLSDDTKPITVVAKCKGDIVFKQSRKIEGTSAEESVCDMSRCLHETNNILIPTLTNRIPMILAIANEMTDYNFVTLIEGMETSLDEVYKSVEDKYGIKRKDLDQLFCKIVPSFLLKNNVPNNSFIYKEQKLLETARNDYQLVCAAENFSTKYDVSFEYALLFCIESRNYSRRMISMIKPKLVFLWNKYSPWHQMLAYVAEEYKIPVVYMENGVIPGTLIFETGGQMGESEPAIEYDKFRKLEVSSMECTNAGKIWERLFKNKLNRWISSDPSVYKDEATNIVLEKMIPNRPIIFYAGQNDYESGLFPYTNRTKDYHSPYFESSDEAAIYLGKIAEKNDWNLLYKRHPMMRGKRSITMPDNVIMNDEINIHDAIDMADVTITILSQSSYVSLIRNKPVVMLGFHQLKGKGCIYEPKSKDDIELQIKNAIQQGFTETQKSNFKRHIAQLCKYYLYRDFTDKSITYGRSLESLIHYIEKVIEGSSSCIYEEVDSESGGDAYEEHLDESGKVEFSLDLGIRERIKRRLIKESFIKGTLVRKYLMNASDECLYVYLMYLSQISRDILDKYSVEETLVDLYDAMRNTNDEKFIHFWKLMNAIDKEVANRLRIELVKDKYAYQVALNRMNISDIFKYQGTEIGVLFVNKLSEVLREAIELGKAERIAYETFNNKLLSDREKIYVFEIMYQKGYCSKDIIKYWNEILCSTNDLELMYYFGIYEVDVITFRNPEYIYKNYYKDRKKFLSYAADLFVSGIVFEKKATTKNNKIVILVSGLHGVKFASTRLQAAVANELARRNYQVCVYVTDINYRNNNDGFAIKPQTVRNNFSKQFYQQDHWLLFDTNVEVKYFNDKKNGIHRFREVISSVYEFNPCAVIDITNEEAIYNPVLIQDFKVISIPLNGYVTSGVSSVYISRKISYTREQEKKYGAVDTQIMKEANLYLPYPDAEHKYSRIENKISKDATVLVTVGNRLEYELNEKIQVKIKNYLKHNGNVVWIFVGKVERTKLVKLEEEIASGKVRLWGYENDLPALYKICDIYVDFPRSGGGGSVACAVQNYIPALIVDMPSDIIPFIGKRYATSSFDESLLLLEKLVKDSEKRQEIAKEEYRNLMAQKWSITKYVDVIVSAINERKK